MKRFLLVLFPMVAVALLMPGVGHAQGTVEDITIYSPSIPADRPAKIYLPEGYEDSNRRYPVVYYLHGYGYDHALLWWFFNIDGQLDALISSGAIEPIIFVGPSGYEDRYRGAYYTDSSLYGGFESYIAHDVVDYVDENYRTIPGREFRHIIGHSMGGYGTMRIALKHSELFGSTSSMAGVLSTPMYMETLVEGAVAETPGPPYEFDPATGSVFATIQLYACSGAWSPNMDNPPYYVDLPCDEFGEIIEEVAARWADHDPARLASDYADGLDEGTFPMDLWLGIGLDDHGLRPYSDAFSETLDMLGLEHAFVDYEGDHFIVPLDVVLPHIDALIPIETLALDIKPGSCPNSVNPNLNGTISAALLGDEEFDVSTVDPGSVRLNLDAAPLRWAYEDVATPYVGESCECWEDGPDGWTDLSLKFSSSEVRDVLGDVVAGEVVPITVSGFLTDGTALLAEDCIVIVGGGAARTVAPAMEPRLETLASKGGTVHLSYTLPLAGEASVTVFDVRGREVVTLVDGLQQQGEHKVQWDGRDASRRLAARGVYFVRLRSGDGRQVEKVLLTR